MKIDKIISVFAIIVLLIIVALIIVVYIINTEDEDQPDMVHLITGQYKHPQINLSYQYKYNRPKKISVLQSEKRIVAFSRMLQFSIIASTMVMLIINHGPDPCSIKEISLCKTKKYSMKAYKR